MIRTAIAAAIGIFLFAAPASAGIFGGGKNFASVNLGVSTGKGGLVGSLLGGKSGGKNALKVNAKVKTGKAGILGLIAGGGGHGGRGGCGCH